MRHIITTLLAILTALLIGYVQISEQAEAEQCYYLDPYSVTVETVDALILEGWYGDPTDNAERLYSPECK